MLSESFNSRPSCEGRPPSSGEPVEPEAVSIHAPRVRGDQKLLGLKSNLVSFNSRPSCEGRQQKLRYAMDQQEFQFTPLV